MGRNYYGKDDTSHKKISVLEIFSVAILIFSLAMVVLRHNINIFWLALLGVNSIYLTGKQLKPKKRLRLSYPKDFYAKATVKKIDKLDKKKNRFCNNCGEELDPNVNFCFVCGQSAAFESTMKPKILKCEQCGEALDSSMPACPYCDKTRVTDPSYSF